MEREVGVRVWLEGDARGKDRFLLALDYEVKYAYLRSFMSGEKQHIHSKTRRNTMKTI